MLGKFARVVLRVTFAGVAIGAVTAGLGLGAIAISEVLSRRNSDRFEDEFLDEPLLAESSSGAQTLDDDFLQLLACPVCKTPVVKEDEWLVCASCSRQYPIRDGIPVMLVEEAVLSRAAGAAD